MKTLRIKSINGDTSFQDVTLDIYYVDFIPIVELDTEQLGKSNKEITWKYEGFSIEEMKNEEVELSQLIEKNKRKPKLYAIEFNEGVEEIVVRFCVYKGNKSSKDNGYIHIRPNGLNIKTKKTIKIKYNQYIALRISAENIAKNASIDFWAEDDGDIFFDSKNKMDIFCGKIYFIEPQKCFCDRDFTEDELKEIVVALRKGEKMLDKKKEPIKNKKKDENGKDILKDGKPEFVERTLYEELGEEIFTKGSEKIEEKEANFRTFALLLNKMFRKYEINTCLRKMHFLAQSYHETQRFTRLVETINPDTYNGYIGRGFLHLTKEYNYQNYVEYLSKGEKPTADDLKKFRIFLSTSLWYALDSAGWFWKNTKLNSFADEDNIKDLTEKINGGLKGFEDRKLYLDILKEVMKYEKEKCPKK